VGTAGAFSAGAAGCEDPGTAGAKGCFSRDCDWPNFAFMFMAKNSVPADLIDTF